VKLDHLAFDQLIELKERIDNLIQNRLVEERANLLKKLEVLHRYESKMRRVHIGVHHAGGKSGEKESVSGGDGKKKRRSKLAPKYRDPVSGATWAGRGRQPRWILEAIQAGKRPDDFLIPSEQLSEQ
jgi:DNA-binding protein H-NS